MEIFEIIRKPHGMRFAVLAINVAIVAYLARELKRTRTLRHGPD